MAISPETLRRIAAIDMPVETLRQVLIAIADGDVEETIGDVTVTSSGAERTRKWRVRKASQGDVTVTSPDPSSPPPPKRYNQTPTTPPSRLVDARAKVWFSEEFYPGWPNKVDRKAAERAAIKLFRELDGEMAQVISGRDAYVKNKPVDRAWMNPATFLNGKRYLDDYSAGQPRAGPPNREQRRNPYFKLIEEDEAHARDYHDGPTIKHADAAIERHVDPFEEALRIDAQRRPGRLFDS